MRGHTLTTRILILVNVTGLDLMPAILTIGTTGKIIALKVLNLLLTTVDLSWELLCWIPIIP